DGIIESRQDGKVVASFVMPEVDDEVLVAFSASGGAPYFHQDDVGNVVALTDASGKVVEYYDYDDYGAPSFLDAQGAPIIGSDGRAFANNNPWSPRGGTVSEMKNGAVKFFNETKGFGGMARGGDRDHYDVLFNPKEYNVTVRGWDPKKKEEGGRHTPFHNKGR